MNINRVTITGPDDKTDLLELMEMSVEYPFVEWGILFSVAKAGTNRYPSLERINELTQIHGLKLSAHLCGWFSRSVVEKKQFSIIDNLDPAFKRVQINYNFKYKAADLGAFIQYARETPNRAIIFQYNQSNKSTIDAMPKVALPSNIHFLYDSSGGYGKEISNIGNIIGENYTGYAGGINPDNIAKICANITKLGNTADVWIDMETGARNTMDELDIDAVEELLYQSNNFVKY